MRWSRCLAWLAISVCCQGELPALETAPLTYEIPSRSGVFLPYAASHSLSERNPRITRILFSIHGTGSNALRYFDNAHQAASRVGGVLEETLIIAPQLYEKSLLPDSVPEGLLYWRTSPYRGSSKAAVGPQEKAISLSAYAVLDRWIERLARRDTFPQLQEIVLVGHSAGGQLVQRYALVGQVASGEVEIRYVVSAPSSYAYPSAERYQAGGRRFAVPQGARLEACPGYNRWGEGLEAPYRYFAEVEPAAIAASYATKRVVYLCGEDDADPWDESLGKSCGARMQGAHRLQRMIAFQAYLKFRYGDSIAASHRFFVVPNVGHHGLGTMTSRAGLRALFGPRETLWK